MLTTREVIQAALEQHLVDEKGKPVQLGLLPGLTADEADEWARSLPVAPPDDVLDLVRFCSGIEGTLEELDFTGRRLVDGVGLDFLVPEGVPIAHDGCGNFWVVDLPAGGSAWGPIYYLCHDAPVMLLQAATVHQFVTELFKMYTPGQSSLVAEVYNDRVFNVWGTNPGVIPHAAALASSDPDLKAFAASLDDRFEIIDLRGAAIGMGFSWGRYGPKTEIRRFGSRPMFAYRRPEKRGLFSKLFGG